MSGYSQEKSFAVVAETRRKWPAAERKQIVAETEAASVSSVARRHGVATSLVFRWRREAGVGGKKSARKLAPAFVPVALPVLAPASWLAVIESGDRQAIEALSGLRSLIAIAGGESTLPTPEQDRLTGEAPDLIPEWVETLSYRRLAHNPIAPVSADAAFKNIGRNDRCPCGSGRKYKKCHGAN